MFTVVIFDQNNDFIKCHGVRQNHDKAYTYATFEEAKGAAENLEDYYAVKGYGYSCQVGDLNAF